MGLECKGGIPDAPAARITAPKAAYWPEFDVMRAVACLLVIAFHARVPGFSGGFLGVDLFFVLSGFLTARMILPCQGGPFLKGFLRFLSRRFWRLWPLLATVSVAIALFHIVSGNPGHALGALPAMAFVRNLVDMPLWMYVHTWTLAVEMQTYLLIAVMGLLAPSVRAFSRLCLAAVLVVMVLRLHFGLSQGWSHEAARPWVDMGGLFLGALLAGVPAWRMSGPARAAVVAASVGLLAVAGLNAQHMSQGTYVLWGTLAELGAAGLIAAVVMRPEPRARLWSSPAVAALRWLGVLSYGMYLWHYPVAVLLRHGLDWPETFAVTLALSTGLAWITYHLIEQPLRKGPGALRARARPGPGDAATA